MWIYCSGKELRLLFALCGHSKINPDNQRSRVKCGGCSGLGWAGLPTSIASNLARVKLLMRRFSLWIRGASARCVACGGGGGMQINQAHDASAQLAAHWLHLATALSRFCLPTAGCCHFASWLMSYMRRFNTNFLCIFKSAVRKPTAKYLLLAKTWSLLRCVAAGCSGISCVLTEGLSTVLAG